MHTILPRLHLGGDFLIVVLTALGRSPAHFMFPHTVSWRVAGDKADDWVYLLVTLQPCSFVFRRRAAVAGEEVD